MPPIADPHGARPYDVPSENFRHAASNESAPSLRLRIRTVRHRSELTRALAEGADPSARRELALRAAQLTSDRSRRALVRSLRRAIADAHDPLLTRLRAVIIRRSAVLEAQSAIDAMIERLHSPVPLRAEGMALAERILTNAERSPLYNRSEPGELPRAIRVATEALDPAPAESHEFPLAA